MDIGESGIESVGRFKSGQRVEIGNFSGKRKIKRGVVIKTLRGGWVSVRPDGCKYPRRFHMIYLDPTGEK